jgi:hypothetical protein
MLAENLSKSFDDFKAVTGPTSKWGKVSGAVIGA